MKPVHLAAGLLAIMFLFAISQCISKSGGAGPSTIIKGETQLEALLERIAFTSPAMVSGGQPGAGQNEAVYQISFRTCPPCIQSHENILPELEAAGIETRLVTTARKSRSTADERAAVVENARRQDWNFTQDWWADRSPNRFYAAANLPPVEGDVEREAELAQLQDDVNKLANILALSGTNFAFPTLIWRGQDGTYKAAVGYNPALTAQIISDVTGG